MGFTELIVLGIIIMILVGPKQLPQVLQAFGKIMREIKKARNEFTRGIDRDDDFRNMRDSIQEVKSTVDGHIGKIRTAVQDDIRKISEEPTQPEVTDPEGKPRG